MGTSPAAERLSDRPRLVSNLIDGTGDISSNEPVEPLFDPFGPPRPLFCGITSTRDHVLEQRPGWLERCAFP